MDSKVKAKIKQFLLNGQINECLQFIELVKVTQSERTQSQHNALFLWFTMIEREAENSGVTWNQLVGHTHQLRITSEGLHIMCKQLQKALWGQTSTKQLKKNGQIDILIEHFVDLFSKVGMTLPPFPCDEDKQNQKIKAIDLASNLAYPEDYQEPTI
jgi:hypothetical protein